MERRKTIVLVALAILGFVGGIAGEYIAPGKTFLPLDAFVMIGATALIFSWYYIDSNQRAYRRGPVLNVGMIGLSLVAMPYYLVRTRGWVRGGVGTLVFLVAAVSWSLLDILGRMLVRWAVAV